MAVAGTKMQVDLFLIKSKLKCLFKHDYQGYQHSIKTSEFSDRSVEIVIAFKICKRCAHSKLIHILE